jgi:serine/threonine protein kinase
MIRYVDGNIRLSDNPDDNFVSINFEDFYLSYLNPKLKANKGASSNLFILNDPTGETEDRVIKICKTPYYNKSRDKRILRFKREIKAFKIARKNELSKIINYYDSGVIEIDNNRFLYIILEKAQSDLASYLEKYHFDFPPSQKLVFCLEILVGIQQLHSAKIYHRDIKHDNILIVNNEFKIADLGLVEFQDKDAEISIDYPNEKIGPIGWLCPEATNKWFTKNKQIGFTYDCEIDSKSDIFQLGKLFWYVFQGNLPLGQIKFEDVKFEDNDFFEIILLMLQYDKERRPDINSILNMLEPIKLRLIV